jgi:hypothetical protein
MIHLQTLTFYSLAKIDASATHTSKTVSSRCLYLTYAKEVGHEQNTASAPCSLPSPREAQWLLQIEASTTHFLGPSTRDTNRHIVQVSVPSPLEEACDKRKKLNSK